VECRCRGGRFPRRARRGAGVRGPGPGSPGDSGLLGSIVRMVALKGVIWAFWTVLRDSGLWFRSLRRGFRHRLVRVGRCTAVTLWRGTAGRRPEAGPAPRLPVGEASTQFRAIYERGVGSPDGRLRRSFAGRFLIDSANRPAPTLLLCIDTGRLPAAIGAQKYLRRICREHPSCKRKTG
jgi:hypothetical protein